MPELNVRKLEATEYDAWDKFVANSPPHRKDVDVHEKVASEIGKIIGEHIEESLDFWRAMFATLNGRLLRSSQPSAS